MVIVKMEVVKTFFSIWYLLSLDGHTDERNYDIKMVIIFMHDAVTAKDYNYYLNRIRMNFLKNVTM